MPKLNDNDQARLLSCMEEIRNVVGEAVSDKYMVKIVLKHEFDLSKSLDEILNTPETSVATMSSSLKTEIDKGEKPFCLWNSYNLTIILFYFVLSRILCIIFTIADDFLGPRTTYSLYKIK